MALEDPGPRRPVLSRFTRAVRQRGAIARRDAEDRIREESERRSWVRIALDAFERDRDRAGALLAGGLAFRLFLWSLPLSLVLVTLFGFLADDLDESPEELALDSGMAAAIAGMVSGAVRASSSGRLFLLVLGVAALALASRSTVRALWIVHSVAWDLGRTVPARISGRGAAAFTGLTVAAIAVHVVASPLYGGGLPTDTLVTAGLMGALSAAALWAFSKLPHAAESLLGLLPGSIVFGIGVETLQLVTAVYFAGKLERVDDLYGALGLASVILLWLFVVGRLVVVAAMLNASVRMGAADPRAA